ncbi:MAG: PaaI family thioesterase [Thermoguttaceae bacterium]|nr:PaaI family thioesterase [Thermoguttaceae bacterium]
MAEVAYIGEEKQRERMLADKFVCGVLGAELVEAGVGTARVELTLRPEHMNGVGVCQGGVLFSLADFAFAAACNYAEESIVGIEVSISYCKTVKTGKIIAEAKEIARTRSTAVAEARVTDETGKLLCVARGRGYALQPR